MVLPLLLLLAQAIAVPASSPTAATVLAPPAVAWPARDAQFTIDDFHFR